MLPLKERIFEHKSKGSEAIASQIKRKSSPGIEHGKGGGLEAGRAPA